MARPQVDRPNTLNRSERPKRVPINGLRDKLSVQGMEPGWHYIWIRDDEVYRFEMGGYEKVTHDVTVGDRHINTAGQIGSAVTYPGGNGVTLHLFRCLDEVYQAELDSIHQQVDEGEAAMKAQLNSNTDGRYGKVEIEQSKPIEKSAPKGATRSF
jgi:hypothetical protein